jgi:L-Ala-D/L-Glu epimerase
VPASTRISWQAIDLHLRNPFRIAHGVSETRQAFWLRLAGDSGWGEGTIPPYYRIDPTAMTSFWAENGRRSDPFPDDPAGIPGWVGQAGPAPARSALDLALYDRIGRQQGRPLYDVLGLPRPSVKPTAFTIAIDTPAEMARLARQMTSYPIIKVKLGSDDDPSRLAAVREARPDAQLYIDANSAWTAEEAVRQIEALAPYQVALVEQPVARDDFAGMGFVQARVDVPVVADESVQSLADVERLAEAGVQAINIKLMKVGGLTAGLELLHRARALGLRIMLGCMIESSLGVTAMAHLSGLADWLDLDAPLLIANDPFDGLRYDEAANIHIPDRPGIGVVLRTDIE